MNDLDPDEMYTSSFNLEDQTRCDLILKDGDGDSVLVKNLGEKIEKLLTQILSSEDGTLPAEYMLCVAYYRYAYGRDPSPAESLLLFQGMLLASHAEEIDLNASLVIRSIKESDLPAFVNGLNIELHAEYQKLLRSFGPKLSSAEESLAMFMKVCGIEDPSILEKLSGFRPPSED